MELTPQDWELLRKSVSGELSTVEAEKLEQLLQANSQAEAQLQQLMGTSADCEILHHLSSPSLSQTPHIAELIQQMQKAGREGLSASGSKSMEDEAELPKLHLDNLLLIRKIGQGGMGVVYEGFDQDLGRAVAVKFLANGLNQNDVAKQLLIDEAKAAAQLHHENIVTIHSIHLSGETPFLIQQFVPGETLGQRIRRIGRLEKDELISLTLQVARGLAAAHRVGLIHRDLKPDNVLLDSLATTARIADFGLAIRQGIREDATNTTVLAGTPAYMAPEQTRGERLDARSDLFSLGTVLYTAASGASPFDGPDANSVMKRVCDSPTPALSTIRSDLPKWWTRAVDKLLQKDPAKRFQSTFELLKYLETAQTQDNSRTVTVGWAAALVATLMLGALLVYSRKHRSPDLDVVSTLSPQKAQLPIWFELVGDERRFESLVAALNAAPSDSTVKLHGRGTFECEPIDLGNKAITLMMEPNEDVTLKPNETFTFIRFESRLELINIKIDSDRNGEMDFPVKSTIYGKNCDLRMRGCVLRERSFIFCLNIESGSAEIRDSCFFSPEAGSITTSPIACSIDIVNCYFESNTCFMVSPRQILDVQEDPTSIRVEGATLNGKTIARVFMIRPPYTRFSIHIINALNLCQYKVLFTSMFPRIESLSSSPQIVSALERLVTWNESHCVHKSPEFFIGSIRLVSSSLVNCTKFRSWKDWADYWSLDTETSISLSLRPSREQGIVDIIRADLPKKFQNVGFARENR